MSDSVTPWTAGCQASLSITNSWSLLKIMSIMSVMPSNHLILCCPLLPPSIFPASGSFQLSQFFASGGQSIGVSASASVLPMNIQNWFPRDSQESSPSPQFKSINSSVLSFLYSSTLTYIHDYRKNPEKAMALHSSTLAWKIPWTGEPGGLQSMGSLRVGHDWATSLSLFTCMHWRRKWQPTPVFLPGESQGWGSLVGCHLWGRTESDTTEVT